MEGVDQECGEHGKHDHAVREHESVTAVAELPRHESVIGEDRRKPWKSWYAVFAASTRIAAVATWRIQKPIPPPNVARPICESTVPFRLRVSWVILTPVSRQSGDPEEHRNRHYAHHCEGGCGVARLRFLEGLHSVRHRLHPGEGGRPRGKCAQHEKDRHRPHHWFNIESGRNRLWGTSKKQRAKPVISIVITVRMKR